MSITVDDLVKVLEELFQVDRDLVVEVFKNDTKDWLESSK